MMRLAGVSEIPPSTRLGRDFVGQNDEGRPRSRAIRRFENIIRPFGGICWTSHINDYGVCMVPKFSKISYHASL